MSTSKANTPSTRESVYSTWMNLKNLSKGREIKGTIYNIGVIFGVASLVAFTFVLLPFLKPLLWAVLLGAVVYPMKRKVSALMNSWFTDLEQRDGNVFLNILVIPVRTMDSLGEQFVHFVKEHKKVLIGAAIALTSAKFVYEYAPRRLMCWTWRSFMFIHTKITVLLSGLSATIVIGFCIAYLTTVVLLWRNSNHSKFMIAGQSLWVLLLAYGCSFLGPLQVPVFLILIGYGVAGFIYSYKNSVATATVDTPSAIGVDNSAVQESNNKSITEKVRDYIRSQHKRRTSIKSPNPSYSTANDDLLAGDSTFNKQTLNLPLGGTAQKNPVEGDDDDDDSTLLTSDMFFKVLFYSWAATVLFKNPWLLFISVVPLVLHFIKQLLQSTGAWSLFTSKVKDLQSNIDAWISERYSAILPVCLPGVLELNRKIHNTLRDSMKSSIELTSSIAVIVAMLLIVVSSGIFFAAQIYSEGFQVAQLGHEVVQKAFLHRPELKNFLPENSFDNLVENAHKYGRNTIETYIDGILADAEKEQAEKLKQQVLLTWDRLVQNMLDRHSDEDAIGPKMGYGLKDSIEEIVDSTVVKEGIIAWAKSNVGMLKDVMDSVLIIVKSNIYLIASVLGSIFSVVLGGGVAVITFIVDTIIFFTALFYLLSSSGDRYAPLAVVTTVGFSSGPRIAEAVEGSIAGVITATAKIALFHGMFTWLTHTVFSANVVYLPAVLASVLAAAPFLGTYWCAVPAFLDLWLAQDRFWMAVVLLVLHVFIPSSVDAAVYAEIKSAGHPYLTGLSIAGGLYWLGLQGAVLGPLLLCFVVIMFELTLAEIKDSPTSTTTNLGGK